MEFGKRYRDLALREYDLLSENLERLRSYFSFNSMDDVAELLKQAPETFTQMDLDALLKEKDVAGRLRHYERALPPARYQSLFRARIEKK